MLIDPTTSDERGVVCSMRDITERRQMENELRAALEKERRLVEQKSRFSMMVSHEFRTPLASIQTSNELIHTYYDRLSSERRGEAFNNISKQVTHLTTLLDDILNISRADLVGQEFKPQQHDIRAFCDSVVKDMLTLANGRKHIDYVYGANNTQAFFDADLIRRALVNLISNAIKYSGDSQSIRFEVAHSDDEWLILVEDYGIGIPETDLAKLFDTFHRGSNVGNIQGTGLGLAIVKRAVESHGGKINVHSVEGVGTTFVVQLPLQPV
jgi:signal transduction histidine kinase